MKSGTMVMVMCLLRVSDLGREPQILTGFLVVNLDRRWQSCMDEGSGHGVVLWAGHRGTLGPLKLVVESWASDSFVKTY